MYRAQISLSPAANTKIDTSTWLGMSVSLRGSRGAEELELELLLLAPAGASRSSFSAKSLLTSAAPASAIGVVPFGACAPGELLLFACPLPFEGVKKSMKKKSIKKNKV